MSPAPTQGGARTPESLYRDSIARRGYIADPAQERAVTRLQRLYEELLAFKQARRTRLHKLISRHPPPRGVYLWGGVGRGKSFLMDSFYSAVPYRRKCRVHFHGFMRDIHAQFDALRGEADPLVTIAERLASAYRLICFDEFHVCDIADAMILGRLAAGLFERGIVFCMTSNYAPEALYPNGLQRDNFLPAIKLLKERLDVVEVNGEVDYRLRALEKVQVYLTPIDGRSETRLARSFADIAETSENLRRICLDGRELDCVRCAAGVVWFDFATLCGGPRSQRDYLELAQRFHTVFVSNVPVLGRQRSDEARRFTWLVDVLYDAKVNMIISAADQPERLYVEGVHSGEFARTASRLREMQTREYLSLARSAVTPS